jgi:hypothetical protein
LNQRKQYPDGVFASDYDIVSDTSKARRFGFHDLVDTEEMFRCSFGCFQIFGVTGSFRDLPSVLDHAERQIETRADSRLGPDRSADDEDPVLFDLDLGKTAREITRE